MKKNKSPLIIISFIIIVCICGIVYANRSVFSIKGDGQVIYTLETGQMPQFGRIKNSVAVTGREGIIALNNSGGQAWHILKNTSTPCMQYEGSYTLLFDRGGRELITYNGNTKMAELTADQSIITAKINSKGYIAVVTNETGYKSKIEILDQHGQPVYKWQICDDYVIDVDISPNCKQFAVSMLKTLDGKAIGNIAFVDMVSAKIISETKNENSISLMVKYTNDSSLVAVGESELLGFNSGGVSKWKVNYGGRTLQTFRLDEKCNAILALSGSRNNTSIEVYSSSGKKTGEYISDFEIKAIDIIENTIAIAEQRNIKLLNYAGRVKSEKTVKKDVKAIVALPAKSVAIVGGSTVDILKL